MEDSHKCPHGYTYPHVDGKPLPPEILQRIANVLNASLWITMLSSTELWTALRRIPPKAFLLELVDAWLVHAMNARYYVYFVPEDEKQAALEERCAPLKRLRDLLIAWEPPVVTPEIREAAVAAHVLEFGSPPTFNLDELNDPPAIPLESMLLWPEGEWDEAAFVAGQTSNE